MAILDIDRHIVTDLSGLFNKITRDISSSDRVFNDIKKLVGKLDIIINGEKANCEKLKDIKNKLTNKIERLDVLYQYNKECFSESKALLMHIINRIKEIDTGKGKEMGESDES